MQNYKLRVTNKRANHSLVSIYFQDILPAMKTLGLNPAEQEVIDLSNKFSTNGLVYFPDFCSMALKNFREENMEHFSQTMFKVFCGTDPYGVKYRAKKYKFQDRFLTRTEFKEIMLILPIKVRIY